MVQYTFSKALSVARSGHETRAKLNAMRKHGISEIKQAFVYLTPTQGRELYKSCLRYQNYDEFQGYGYDEEKQRHKIKINDVLFYWPKEEKAA